MQHSLCRVIETKNADFAVGDLFVARYGWRSHTVSDGKDERDRRTKLDRLSRIDPKIPLSPSTALGVLGMPG